MKLTPTLENVRAAGKRTGPISGSVGVLNARFVIVQNLPKSAMRGYRHHLRLRQQPGQRLRFSS